MKAMRIHAQGGPDVLRYEDAPEPNPGPDEMRLRVAAAGVNPADWKTRAGFLPTHAPLTFPYILGWDVAGTVEAVGSAVTAFAPGDAVYGLIRFPQPGATYATATTAPVADLTPIPPGLNFIQAAALPLVMLTAWQAMFELAHLQAGQTVVIHGASGGVGHVAMQLAKNAGAQVLAVTSARHAEFVRMLGADQVIDASATLEACATEVDLVFDTVGGLNGPRLVPTMRRGGIYVSIAWALPEPTIAEAVGIAAHGLLVHPDGRALSALEPWLTQGTLRPTISAVFPLANARLAHERGEAGHLEGKLVLDCQP